MFLSLRATRRKEELPRTKFQNLAQEAETKQRTGFGASTTRNLNGVFASLCGHKSVHQEEDEVASDSQAITIETKHVIMKEEHG